MSLDWHSIVGTLGGILALAAIAPYIKDILHGTTRPNIVSYGLWAILLAISIFAQISAGTSWSVVLLIGDFIGTSTIVVLCLVGYGYSKYGWVEWTCLALAVLAIASWQLTQQPLLAIIFAVLADAMAAVPTIVKAYRDPWSELPVTWLIIAFGALLGILSTTIWDAANLLFPAYLLAVNGLTGIIALTGRRLTKKTKLTKAGFARFL